MEFGISEIITIAGFLSAGIWFYWTQKFKPRVEFDVDCRFFSLNEKSNILITEIRFIFSNKGFIQHTIKLLELSVHGLCGENPINVKLENNNVIFTGDILKRQSAIPKGWHFWVRPNVNQVITKIIKIENKYKVIRIIASFSYKDSKKSLHTAQRVFQMPD